jgi:tyrosyl-tRNA synthetase
MDVDEKFDLIKQNTLEIVSEKELKDLLKKNKKPVAYLGYAPTGRIHLGYFVPLLKVADFLKAGFKFKILLADMHAYLDDRKTPWDLLKARSDYYKEMISQILKAVGADTKNLEFVVGSSYQLKEDYAMNLYKMFGEVTLNRTKRAASEVVRSVKDTADLGSFVYPLMQINDVIGLKADVAYGGVDQRGIYMLGRELLPKIGEKKYVCVFTSLIPSFSGGKTKMSASDPKSKVDVLDSEKDIEKKINSAFCPVGEVEGNAVLTFVKNVLFPINKKLEVKRPEKFGGDFVFDSYEILENHFVAKKLHPMDLKKAVARDINLILDPIRKHFASKKTLMKKAYPQN